jgi:GrpB-like predicted nucleotidyltransferase (UPF0157 family)
MSNRAERFRQRGMRVAHHAFVLKLRQPQHHRLGQGDAAEHTHQQVLHQLEAADRSSELRTLGRTAQRMFIAFRRWTNKSPSEVRGE